LRTLEQFFRTDRLPFTVESKAAGAIAGGYNFRDYERFSDMRADVVDVRIYQGIHFRFADDVAYRTGQRGGLGIRALREADELTLNKTVSEASRFGTSGTFVPVGTVQHGR
jgi:hypothetical protein